MKELTIEQKAAAYDEAIKRAKDFMNGEVNYELKIGENIMCWVFPELRESEDERIRKSLIVLLRHFCKGYRVPGLDFPVSFKDMLAWLEKQGESDETKAKTILINKGYPIDANGTFPTYEEMYDIIKEGLEKQGEPTEINPSEFDLRLNRLLKQFETLPKEELASSLSFYLNVVQNNGTYKEEKQGEQKPTETEKGAKGNDREIPFSKQEWSEENEMMLDTCIDLIEHFPRPCGRVIGPWKDCIDWLKSLRPQKQWKPSEEQMKALRKAEATIGVNHVVLAGLISDLEKLTE